MRSSALDTVFLNRVDQTSLLAILDEWQQLIQSTVTTVDCLARLRLWTSLSPVDFDSVSVDVLKLHKYPPLLVDLIKYIKITINLSL